MKKSNKANELTNQNYKRTIEKSILVKYFEKKSIFISQAFPVENLDAVRSLLQKVRETYSDANHHCFAYILGFERNIYKYYDDGEPAGTAGKPIYQTIQNLNLTDVLVVVSRYFGGIKLGASGLFRAYYNASRLALENAKIIDVPRQVLVTLEISFPDYNRIKQFVHKEFICLEEDFSDVVKVSGRIPLETLNDFENKINNLLSRRIKITIG